MTDFTLPSPSPLLESPREPHQIKLRHRTRANRPNSGWDVQIKKGIAQWDTVGFISQSHPYTATCHGKSIGAFSTKRDAIWGVLNACGVSHE